jgi:hypothetical protein
MRKRRKGMPEDYSLAMQGRGLGEITICPRVNVF